jgi:midasin (ATPase involved in ribosome maturation)
LFSFTSCEKDEIDTWVSLEADKSTVAINETVSFTMTGNAETYVVYTGDTGHDFAKSYLVITGGKKVDQEDYVLTQARLDTWIPILNAEIIAYNLLNPNTTLDANAIIAGLRRLVDKSYYIDTAANRIRELMPTFKSFSDCQSLVVTYFTNLSVLLTPVGGFSTGVAINRNELTYSYKFTTAGTYVVTLLGTRLSDKIYSGSGYIYNSTASASEYNYNRNTDTVTIVVQ